MEPKDRVHRLCLIAAPLVLVATLLQAAGDGAPALVEPGAGRAPQAVAPQTIDGHDVLEVALGIRHSCARVDNGWVYCWGRNQFGQLGNGNRADSANPVRVAGLTSVVQISSAFESTCALRNSGRVLCWGRNNFGQLGDGTTTDRPQPVRVVNLTDVFQVAAGRFHSCAVRSSGRVFCWGLNSDGQLGDGTTIDRLTPVRVNGAGVTRATQVATGVLHSCLRRQYGQVTCWGNNAEGQLGDGTRTSRPDPLPLGITNVTQLGAGDFHTCVLHGGGRVFCWGSNFYGAMGNGTTAPRLTPGRVNGLTQIVAIGAGGFHNCAIRASGRVFCWGWNAFGQIGDGTSIDRLTPVRTAGSRMINATQLGLGSTHSCGARANGRAFCWGSNFFGQLGDGTTTDSLVPVRVRD